MAERVVTAPATVFSAERGWTRLPIAARIAVIYVIARLVTTAFFVFAAALYWTQVFAFYERHAGPGTLTIDGEVVPVAMDDDGLDPDAAPWLARRP